MYNLVFADLEYRLGSARAVNRRYISDCVPLKIRLQASAGFVSASALGMACGPALAGFLQTKFTVYTLTFNQNTLPGWIMSLAWLLYLFWLAVSFKEPDRSTYKDDLTQSADAGKLKISYYLLHTDIETWYFSFRSCYV
jgi:MFS family permease